MDRRDCPPHIFVSSSLLGRWRKRQKESLGYEKGGQRDALQVLANGGAPALVLLIGYFAPTMRELCLVAYLAGIAEANADTWATEIGSASKVIPRLITTGKLARPGTSGAISLPGLLAALAGSGLIACFVPLTRLHLNPMDIILVLLGGFLGMLFDSLLGATVQEQYYDPVNPDRIVEKSINPDLVLQRGIYGLNNDVVNFTAIVFSMSLVAIFKALH